MGSPCSGGVGVLKFDTMHWSQEIAAETGKPEYQTCEIVITDPSLVTVEYDIDTAVSTETGDGTLYEGQARLIAVRRGVNYEGASQGNSKTITSIRIQIPGQELPVTLRKGTTAVVTSAPLNRTLENYLFYLASDVHGSSAATRTFEFNLDGDTSHD